MSETLRLVSVFVWDVLTSPATSAQRLRLRVSSGMHTGHLRLLPDVWDVPPSSGVNTRSLQRLHNVCDDCTTSETLCLI